MAVLADTIIQNFWGNYLNEHVHRSLYLVKLEALSRPQLCQAYKMLRTVKKELNLNCILMFFK